MSDVAALIKRHEGLRLKSYVDTVGKVTIGYGRNLSDNGISQAMADTMVLEDIEMAKSIALSIFGSGFASASDARQAALTDMAFNMGQPRLSQFTHLIAAVKAGDWALAATEALSSRWASQVGARAQEDADLLRHGVWPDVIV